MIKREIICFFVFIIIFSSSVLAISVDMKESYSPGETSIFQIKGNLLNSVGTSNIEFYRGHVKIPVNYDVKKLGDNYYVWFISPDNQNNYTFALKDVSTYVNGQVEQIEFDKNFSVVGNYTDYNVKPGIIYTDQDFDISVWLYGDEKKVVPITFIQTQQYNLIPGENKISFSINEITGNQLIIIGIGKYSIPAYIMGNKSSTVNQTILDVPFIIEPREINQIVLISDRPRVYPIKLINKENYALSPINLRYNKNLYSIYPDTGINLSPNQEIDLNLTLRVNSGIPINDRIYFGNDNNTWIPININFTTNASIIVEQNNNSNSSGNSGNGGTGGYRCSELSGKRCIASNEVCDGVTTSSLDGDCCLSKCVVRQDNSYSWIGYMIGVLLIAALVYVFMKYKKVGPDKNPLRKRIREAEKI